MELIEIKGLFEMDYGSPSPTIISNDSELFIAFYADKENSSVEPQERNTIYDIGIFALKFKAYLKYTFGLPGNETIHQIKQHATLAHPFIRPLKQSL